MSQKSCIARELGDRAGEGQAYCNLGSAYGRKSDITQAIEFYTKSLDIAKEVGDKAGEGLWRSRTEFVITGLLILN